MYPLLLLPPLILLAYDRSPPSQGRGGTTISKSAGSSLVAFAALNTLRVAVVLGLLLGLSSVLVGGSEGSAPNAADDWLGTPPSSSTSSSWEFLAATYGVQLTLADLTPNSGLWWYFFVEMFDSFRAFFLGVFWLHLSAYVGGLSIRLRRQPLVAITLLLGIFSIFKPYPSTADTSLFLALVPLFRHVFPLMRYTFLTAAVTIYASFLGPAFYHLWIYAGSGNANFFYAITLVWSLGQALLLSDLTFAVLRDEWEVERPEMVGKDVRQI